MDNIKSKLLNVEDFKLKNEFIRLIQFYMQPAFGSITKRDLDIELFMSLQRLGIISEKPDAYDVISTLRITRSKARNLIYESELRRMNRDDLKNQLKDILLRPVFLDNGKMLYMEVENPLLHDYIKAQLKILGHITDGSFSIDIIKLTHEAYSALSIFVFEIQNTPNLEILKQYLVNNKIISDTSVKGVISGFLMVVGKKIASDAGEAYVSELTGKTFNYLQRCFNSKGVKISLSEIGDLIK